MGKLSDCDIWLPATEEEAVEFAVREIFKAASLLATAAALAKEGEAVDHYINTASTLRDLADLLHPDTPDWPENVIPFVPRATG